MVSLAISINLSWFWKTCRLMSDLTRRQYASAAFRK